MDVWQEARRNLDGLPGGQGLNIAYEAVDRHVARGNGERVAFRFIKADTGVHDLTYSELARQSNRFANVLRTLGVAPGDAVFSFAGRIPALYIAALGSLKAGALFSSLFANFGEEPLRTRLTKGCGRVLVTTAPLYARRIAALRSSLPQLTQVVTVGSTVPEETVGFDGAMAAAEDAFTIPPTDPEDPAFVHFTSGTTGTPKGALHVHAAAAAHYATAASLFDLQPDDIYWCTADPGWVTGISYGLVAPLLHGVTAIIDEGEFDPARWYRIIQEQRVNVLYTAPTALRMLMKAGARLARSFDLSSLRLIASVGEALNPEVVRWGRQAFGRDIHDTWWQTETGAIVIGTAASQTVVLGTIGCAVPGIESAIARRQPDGTLAFVAEPDQVGELVLKAGWPSMFRGYLGEPHRYAKSFIDDWYLTGDLMCRDSEGRFSFVSRGDELIKSAGHLIGPFEVESALLEHPAVAEAGAIGKPDPLIGEIVKVYVTLKDGFAADEALRADVLGFARRRLGPALAPREIVFCRSLPKTGSGKIVRRLLLARELGVPVAGLADIEAPEQQ